MYAEREGTVVVVAREEAVAVREEADAERDAVVVALREETAVDELRDGAVTDAREDVPVAVVRDAIEVSELREARTLELPNVREDALRVGEVPPVRAVLRELPAVAVRDDEAAVREATILRALT